jgi:hypothetical protein
MIKAVDKTMEIGGIHLLEKRGGRSGEFKADREARAVRPAKAGLYRGRQKR